MNRRDVVDLLVIVLPWLFLGIAYGCVLLRMFKCGKTMAAGTSLLLAVLGTSGLGGSLWCWFCEEPSPGTPILALASHLVFWCAFCIPLGARWDDGQSQRLFRVYATVFLLKLASSCYLCASISYIGTSANKAFGTVAR